MIRKTNLACGSLACAQDVSPDEHVVNNRSARTGQGDAAARLNATPRLAEMRVDQLVRCLPTFIKMRQAAVK
ncbi:hypothetical protein [Paenibacillus dendritiformis]|uniref:hypothetical protein n=1 Tax=Paenibacillus dendritiformis TaxID=130049 RepID=UPI0011B58C19|nr:hypothetical protein [Paenibacillus dendritiformis]